MRSREIEHGWLCITEAAKYAQVAEKDINAAIASGDLPAFNHPASDPSARRRNIRISRDDVDDWIRRCWAPVVAV